MWLRIVALTAAVLLAGKIGYREMMYRWGTGEVIVATYKARALKACARDAAAQRVRLPASAWSEPEDIDIVIGQPNLRVFFWHVRDALWKARYLNPYLHIRPRGAERFVLCEYDIVNATASVHRL